MYSFYLRQISEYFDACPDHLSTDQLKQYFLQLVQTKSWSAVKIARNAIQFFYKQVLARPWQWVNIVKPPRAVPLQDVLTINEVNAIINATRQFRYQVYYLTVYSMGLRLSETLNLKVSDIDSHLMRVHLRFTKSKKDRFMVICCAIFTIAPYNKSWFVIPLMPWSIIVSLAKPTPHFIPLAVIGFAPPASINAIMIG